ELVLKRYLVYIITILSLFITGCNADTQDSGDVKENKDVQDVVDVDDGLNSGIIIQDDVVIFPEPNGLTEVKIDTLGEDLPESKDDGNLPVILTFTAGGSTLNTYGEIKVQGSSTAKWPKKNWTL